MQPSDFRELRESKHLTLAQVSEQINIPATTIAAYERGIRKPKIKNLVKLADFYDVSLSMLDFLDYSDDDINSKPNNKEIDTSEDKTSDDIDINYLHQRIRRMLEIDNLAELQNELKQVTELITLMNR
ncbi:helix-turn-helix transcriptional regulator [Lactobacillus salivarius]|uniref:helix-turn-helix domain-containing protein n=2 Tax=Ligilactobacillus salivarius TaxID=1624 RepID=UPI00136A92B9|nr:helix-turn-helix domain-containing protein [Ligilactobacillus salivarius]MYU60414.1 helix-turn-helix transcriptional regulator [Ligilactobacillus salivarius]MYU70744.1 helix-turn-helix transcriptional regulator [Ligilactobacillus salivarius]MYU72636.1 helix-turn-helix transcriptional regulator [Ligilactobacillus salivarius]MYU92159.1 helix-turn-helix transcriptional regulator [Ligilactobacillus salivarius]MYY37462.1 helix-turn-helix transcriptional regulator [Ligilactobacillus salivarius]